MKKYLSSFILFLIVFITNAQVDRSRQPEADKPHKLQMGALIPIKMDNGLHVYLAQEKEYPKFTISVSISAPGYMEEERLAEKEVLGEAYNVKLSEKYPNGEIDSAVNFQGALLAVHEYGGTIKGMKRDVNTLLDMYADALLHPIIKQKYIDSLAVAYKRKQEKKKSKKQKKSIKNSFSDENIIDSLLFGTKKEEKKKERIEPNYDGLQLADVAQFLKDKVVANNAQIVIVGDFTKEECSHLMHKYFDQWQSGKPFKHENEEKVRKSIIKNRKIVVTDAPNMAQAKISLSWHLGDAFTYYDKHIELEVLNEIFGESQLSYLYKNIREDKGLCYSIRSSVGCSAGGGRGAIYTSVRTPQTAYAIENIILEMLRIRNFKVSVRDLAIAKNSLIGEYTRSLNPIVPIPYISFAMMKDEYNLPDDYLQTKVEKYDQVTRDDIMEMAQKYIDPFHCVISVKGKLSELKGKLEKFGEVLYFDKDGKKIVEHN